LQPLGGNSSRGINANITRKQPTAKDSVAIPVDPQILGASSSAASLPSTNNDYDEDTSNPDLMVLSAEEQDNAMHLLEVVTSQTDTVDSVTDEEADLDLLDNLDKAVQTFDETDPVHSHAEGFIDYFSRINILRNQTAGRISDAAFQENVHKWAPQGNSRDMPTRFIYRCSNQNWGCQYVCYSHQRLEEHILKCSISESNPVKPANFMCRKPNCDRGFKTKSGRKSHEREHDFESRQCDLCKDGK
jgi:hypothetical protein